MYRFIRSSGAVTIDKFWTRFLVVVLLQCVLIFTFLHYQVTQRRTMVYRDTTSEPVGHLSIVHYQNDSLNLTSRNTSNNIISTTSTEAVTRYCPLIPSGLKGQVSVNTTVYSFEELAERLPLVKEGGTYQPSSCVSRHKVAIIIPFRDRDTHLKILLNNLHPFLQKQQLEYGIFVSELIPNGPFNKAAAMNIGFLEVAKKHDYECFIFHDVDLIPENDNNMYTCPENPKHMSVAIDKFDYELPYVQLFGGVTAMRKEQFEAVNGYSNKYFGWGGEDDDMYARIRTVGLAVTRYTSDVSTYRMLKHIQQTMNEDRHQLMATGAARWKYDGLNTIKYTVSTTVRKRLYTHILADFDQPDIIHKMSEIRQPRMPNTVRFIDENIEKALVKKANYLMNTTELDPRVKEMLIFEFVLSRPSTISTKHVAEILRRIIPNFRWSPETIKKVHIYKQNQEITRKDTDLNVFERKHKDDLFSNVKMSLMINQFNENINRVQRSIEDHRLKFDKSNIFHHRKIDKQ